MSAPDYGRHVLAKVLSKIINNTICELCGVTKRSILAISDVLQDLPCASPIGHSGHDWHLHSRSTQHAVGHSDVAPQTDGARGSWTYVSRVRQRCAAPAAARTAVRSTHLHNQNRLTELRTRPSRNDIIMESTDPLPLSYY